MCLHDAQGEIMATRSLWRIIPDTLLVLLALVLSTGFAIGKATAACPGAARNAAPLTALPDPVVRSAIDSASKLQIWKTVTIGELKGVNAVRTAIETAPCPISMGDWADEILGRPAFPFSRVKIELDLVVATVSELGFGERGAALADIHARARAIGLELCPAEVGPILRLGYLDQPIGEFLHIAMRPVARYTGELVDFTLANGGAGLLLIGGDARPDVVIPGTVRFVFAKPRLDTVVSSKPTAGEELVKR
jgi:hypothetical protein